MSRGDPLRVRDYLGHIAEPIANIRDYTAGMDAADLPALSKAVGTALNSLPAT